MRSPLSVVIWMLALFLVALVVGGCGGSKKPESAGSVPVVTTTLPTRTVTYGMPSSSMEPTILCARGPANPGCTGAAEDYVLVDEPAPPCPTSLLGGRRRFA